MIVAVWSAELQNVEVSDTRGGGSSNSAKYIKQKAASLKLIAAREFCDITKCRN
jgi:hypothetical protein